MTRGPDRQPRRSGAICAICDLVAGNLSDIPVHRYRLARTVYVEGKARTRAIASIGLCDRCIREHGHAVRDYSGRIGTVRHRHIRRDGGENEWHVHAGFKPRHTHPELGPAIRALTVEQVRAMTPGAPTQQDREPDA
jgi:hypothetical protein